MIWTGKYFTLYEMTASASAKRLKIDNTPTEKIKQNLLDLVTNVLDPLRLSWGRPVIVTSGYRCPKLNKAIGGATSSQHMYGQAADIRTVSDDPEENMKLLRCLIEANLPFDQLICEYPNKNGCPDWIHVSFGPRNRRQMLTCRGGKYYQGINIKEANKK